MAEAQKPEKKYSLEEVRRYLELQAGIISRASILRDGDSPRDRVGLERDVNLAEREIPEELKNEIYYRSIDKLKRILNNY